MTRCKYYDCGWCYAPKVIKSNGVKGACIEPEYCPYLKSQMTEKERIEGEIKILQKKLALIEELEKTKSPVEEAFKRIYNVYPSSSEKSVFWTDTDEDTWIAFQVGYNAAYEEKVAQEPEEEPEELKTLYQMLDDKKHHPDTCVFICNIVKRWMSQYTHNVMSGEYASGYEDCMLVLEEHLK